MLLAFLAFSPVSAEELGDMDIDVSQSFTDPRSISTQSTRASRIEQYEALEVLDGDLNNPVTLEIHKKSREIDLNTTSNIRLLVRSRDINLTKNKYSSFKLMIYEMNSGDRKFSSAQNVTVSNKKK
jgi:hypothetical protein